jgi:hypothetical protein
VTIAALATVFTIARHRSAKVTQSLLGDKEDQVVRSDRFKSNDWLWAYWRQICWSHPRQDFQAMIDRGSRGEVIGRRLLGLSDRLFAMWHKVRDGTRDARVVRESILRLGPWGRRALEDRTECGCARTAGT